MALIDRIKADRLAATKNKNKETKATLTLLLGEIQRFQSSPSEIPTDEEVLARIKSMCKSIDFTIANRVALGLPVNTEIQEKTIITSYQPALMSTKELSSKIDEAIHSTGALSPKQMGLVMGFLSKNYKGLYDGAHAKDIVLSKLKDM